ncbi:MAG: IS5 family transposase [Acidobacteriota bacterium]
MGFTDLRGMAVLPDKYPSPATCWRRLKQREEQNVWLDAWRALLGAGRRRVSEVGRGVSGRQFHSGEKGGSAVGKTKRGKGTKWMVLIDGGGLPLGVRLESASPAEVTLAEATLAEVKVPRAKGRPRTKPERVIADGAYDSDPLRERLKKRGIGLIVPYRKNSKLRRYEDGRKLRRYKRRWIIERTNAWLGQFRRLLVRHEHLLATYSAFFYLACLWITLRRCL